MPPDRNIAEVKNPRDLAALAVTPPHVSRRQVTIAPRRRKTNQSGGRTQNQWVITYDQLPGWTNPLLGWTSSADPMSTVMVRLCTFFIFAYCSVLRLLLCGVVVYCCTGVLASGVM